MPLFAKSTFTDLNSLIRFAPSAKWQIETLITVLSIAGNHCDDSIACLTVCHVIEADSLHSFATHKLFRLLRDDLPRVQIALMHVAVWCIGEYGDHLLRSCETDTGCSDIFEAIAVAEIHGILEAVLRSHLATVVTKSYTLTALMKLSNRLNLGRMESVRLIELDPAMTRVTSVHERHESVEVSFCFDDIN